MQGVEPQSNRQVWRVSSLPNIEGLIWMAGAVLGLALDGPNDDGVGDEAAVGHVAALLPI